VDDGPHAIGQIADVRELTPEGCADHINRNDLFITAQSARGLLAIGEADYGSFDAIVAVGPLRGAIVGWLLGKSVFGPITMTVEQACYLNRLTISQDRDLA